MLGIDETGRGKGRYEVPTDTGVKVWIDRFARQVKLHLPTNWPWQPGWDRLFARVCGPPATPAS